MTVKDLNKDQLRELKVHYYDELLICNENRNISYGEIANIDDLVSDEEIYNEMSYVCFTEEDFFCSTDTESTQATQSATQGATQGGK